MDHIALIIGWLILVAGGGALCAKVLWVAAEFIYQQWCAGMNIPDVIEAMNEWRERHPEKIAKFDKRNAG